MKHIRFFFLFCIIVFTVFFEIAAETYYQELSNRVKINLGATPWKFLKSDASNAQNPTFNDASWAEVGIPHTWCDTSTFLNNAEGGSGSGFSSMAWYRKHFTLDNAYADRKIFVEFEGAHIGAQVYINGTFIPGNSEVNPEATHVVGFIPFIVDITPYVTFGAEENVIAVRVSNTGGFYEYPVICCDFKYGMGDGGLFRPVWMHITDKVYIPANVYSVVNNWGTYVAAVTASDASADIKILTHVQNERGSATEVTLTTKIVEADTRTVVWSGDMTQTVDAGADFVFDQTATVANPKLWYPANSLYGTPYMYRVDHIVQVGGETVDVFESPLGIRVLTWDDDFPLFNGHPHYLWGGSSRYDYPALGSAVPEEQQWRDAKLMAECGGSLWRPGHATGSGEFTAACDAYGICLAQPSGDREGNLQTLYLDDYKATLKKELHRDMIVRDRNNPSIAMWEVSNGPIDPDLARECRQFDIIWDPVHTRAMSDRGYWLAIPSFEEGVVGVISCSATGCETALHQQYPNIPSWGAEAWGGSRGLRANYDHELEFATEYVRNWKNAKLAKCFGLAHWYMADTPGESGVGRSFGASMMDWNRIPKMLYYIYQACWTHYEVKPVVRLANHWNRSGGVTVNAFSNCPSVRLLINGANQGERTPFPESASDNSLMPTQCQWNVTFQSGTLRAEGLDESGNVVCFDEKVTAGSPHHIELTVEPPIVRPDNGEEFEITANGSDAAFILATVVDADGNWCPTASNNITFSVSGPGRYCGGADNNTSGGGLYYHSPFDPELAAEGGMTKIAVRSRFTPGEVTVTATSSGLGQGTASFTIVPIPPNGPVSIRGFANKGRTTSALSSRIGVFGGTVKYFISQPADVSVQIYDANGRVLNRINESNQSEGWHPIMISEKGRESASGVYFVRLLADGKFRCVRRLFIIR